MASPMKASSARASSMARVLSFTPNGGRYEAKWERGYAIEGRYVFNDGLKYEDRNWQYVSQGDRRFYTEVLHDLQPAGKTLLTNEPVPPKIPKGTYDTGHGYFDPDTEQILSYDGKEVLGYPDPVYMQWTKDNCRKGFEDHSKGEANGDAKPAEGEAPPSASSPAPEKPAEAPAASPTPA